MFFWFYRWTKKSKDQLGNFWVSQKHSLEQLIILSLRSVIVPLKIMVNFAISVLFIILNLVPPFLCLAKSVLFCLFESSKWFKSDKILYLISVVLKQRIFKCRKEAKEWQSMVMSYHVFSWSSGSLSYWSELYPWWLCALIFLLNLPCVLASILSMSFLFHRDKTTDNR